MEGSNSLLIFTRIVHMPRAIFFAGRESDSQLPLVWQWEQLTPNSLLHPQFIIQSKCSAETELSPTMTFMFLNTESARHFSFPFIDAITSFMNFNLSFSRLSSIAIIAILVDRFTRSMEKAQKEMAVSNIDVTSMIRI